MKTIPVRKIHPEPHAPDGFGMRALDNLLATQDMIQELHRHDYFFLLAIIRGTGMHTIDFTAYPATDNTVFFMRPGQVHQLHLEQGCRGYILEFTPDFLASAECTPSPVRKGSGAENYCPLNDENASRLFDLFRNILNEYESKRPGYKDVIKASLYILLIELSRLRHQPDEKTVPKAPVAKERLDTFLDLLEKHAVQYKQVTDYAEMMHLSVYQLNSITKNALGKTCSEVINDHLILEAKRFLLATGAQIKEIAYALGFEDVSYFIRFFRKQTGHTPELFRQNFR